VVAVVAVYNNKGYHTILPNKFTRAHGALPLPPSLSLDQRA